jgi:hypothetical protein
MEEKKRNEELNLKIIEEGQNRTVKAMGFKDLDDAITKKIIANNFPLQQPIDPAVLSDLKKAKISPSLGNMFTPVNECNANLEKNQKILFSMKNAASIKQKYQELTAKYKDVAIPLYAKDIQNYFNADILPRCNLLKNSPEKYGPEKNPEIKKVCDRLPEIRRILPELRRSEKSREYQQKAENFVREFWTPLIQETAPTQAAANDKMEKERNEINNYLTASHLACDRVKSLYAYEVSKMTRAFLIEVNTSKPTVDYLTEQFFSQPNQARANEQLGDVKAEIQDIVKKLTPSQEKRNAISANFDDIQLRWMGKPEAKYYKPGTKDVPLLDLSNDSPGPVRGEMDSIFQAFADPGLNYFKELNANYKPEIEIGVYKRSERVDMMPATLMNMQRNPQGFLSLLAHEVGHKIDPNQGMVNGYNLNPEYAKLRECFSSDKSIRMSGNQAGETMADYISAEVLARQLQRVSPEKRAGLLVDAMSTYCLWDASEEENNSSNSSGDHPDSALRVSGIFGANPNLRKTIGCEGAPAKYQLCGIPNIGGPPVGKSRPSSSKPKHLESMEGAR